MDMKMVVDLLNVPVVKEGRTWIDSECPVCGKNKLHFDFKKNVFNCPACGECGGGVIDAWALYRGIDPDLTMEQQIRRKLAGKDIREFFDSKKPEEKKEVGTLVKRSVPLEYEETDIDVRDFTYRTFLSKLTLEKEHREDLLRRGFDDEAIESLGFKSAPKANLQGLAYSLLKEGCILEGVPGFYRDKNDRWTTVKRPGLLIPVRDGTGKIEGLQIRRYGDVSGGKYIYFSSSGKNGGTGAKCFTHLAENYGQGIPGCDEAIVIEGPLKGDLVNYFTGIPVFCIPGVNATKHFKAILPQIKAEGIKKLCIAFDMDYKTNPHVNKALIYLKRMINASGINCEQMIWDDQFKGLDDYLLSKRIANI